MTRPDTAPFRLDTTARRSYRRIGLALVLGIGWGLLMGINSGTPTHAWVIRTTMVTSLSTLAFVLTERWPVAVPGWLARWVLQLVAVVLVIPVAAFIAYGVTAPWPFWAHRQPLQGYGIVTFLGILVGPWVALASMVRQREAFARHQALEFDLARSELERQAVDARMRLLQAQVQPHFLFNTLANVRALVNTGSPDATALLDSLIAYLRAAVPRLQDPATTIVDELQLVTAYLEVMRMRMPDRLRYTVRSDAASGQQRCPPLTVLTLVENAVRPGIDPSEEGGRIDVDVRTSDGRCLIEVSDTGAGLAATPADDVTVSGTGLATLRERLELAFGGRAFLRLDEADGGGVRARLDLPVDATAPRSPPP